MKIFPPKKPTSQTPVGNDTALQGGGLCASEHINLGYRADLAKCDGAEIPSCDRCTRKLAPVAPKQSWANPITNRAGECILFADVEKFGELYGIGKVA